MVEAAGNLHLHTPYSDGEKWHHDIAADAILAGLDFIIATDHNVWVDGIEGWFENEHGRVLLLVGEEVHDVRRRPQANHFLAYGAERELSPCAANPQTLIDATRAAGGYGFLAHPFERDVPLFNERELGWHDWDIEGFTGLEIWNYMSAFKNCIGRRLSAMRWQNPLLARWHILRIAFHPERYISGPEPETLALWDRLLSQGKRVAAVGNSDAHGTPYKMGPWRRLVFPYEFLFRAVNTHVLMPRAFSGDLAHDKKMVLEAIGRGNGWVAYDMAHPTKGFRFSGKGVNKGVMGDVIRLDAGATLQVHAPTKCNIRLYRQGQKAAEILNEVNLTHIPLDPGAYRVECAIHYQGQERGWIYSNPIYLE